MISKSQPTPMPGGTDCCIPDVALGPILSPLPPYRRFDWDPLGATKAPPAPGHER